jgi:hypothetical protein
MITEGEITRMVGESPTSDAVKAEWISCSCMVEKAYFVGRAHNREKGTASAAEDRLKGTSTTVTDDYGEDQTNLSCNWRVNHLNEQTHSFGATIRRSAKETEHRQGYLQ